MEKLAVLLVLGGLLMLGRKMIFVQFRRASCAGRWRPDIPSFD